jgi:type IV secretory pathway TraG/TraD family ATPase VirD4
MALGAVAMALLAALLTPLGVAAAFVVMVVLWTLVQVTALRWWAPLALAAVFAAVLALRWDTAVSDLDRSRKEQLHALFHPQARKSDWGSQWRGWTAPTLWFALPAGCIGAALVCVGRERSRPQRSDHRPRAGRFRVAWAARRANNQPERSLARRGVILGVDERGRTARLRDEDLAGHGLIVGATGSGKTTTLLVILTAAIRRGHPLVVVDLKGDPRLVRSLEGAAADAGRSFAVWSIDGDAGWNPLAAGNPTELKDKLLGLEEWTEPHYRRAAERYLQAVFTLLAHLGAIADLARVVDLMDPARLNRELRHLPDALADRIGGYLDTLAADQLSAIRGLATRLAVITESVAGPFLTPEEAGINLPSTLRDGGVVVFSLNSSTYGELAAHLGALVIQDLKTAAGDLLHNPGALPAYVAVDEFSALGADHLLALLARARGAGLRVLLATQELADLDRAADGFRDQVLGNTATKIAHRQEVPLSADTLALIAGTRQVWHQTFQTDALIPGSTAGQLNTGMGTKRQVDEYRVHPNTLKTLRTGEAVLIRKHPRPDVRVVRVVPPTSHGRA